MDSGFVQYSTNDLVKDIIHPFLGSGGALKVTNSIDLLGHQESLIVCDGRHVPLTQFIDGTPIVKQVRLGTNKDDGGIWSVMADLWFPLWIAEKY